MINVHRTRRVTQVTIAAMIPIMGLMSQVGTAAAQEGTTLRCETYVKFENRVRRVFGTEIAAECPGDSVVHGAPFGNWGVDSNAGTRQNGFQFAGWHSECSLGFLHCDLKQWNSCTRDYPAPNPAYYNHENYYTQRADPDSIETYAGYTYQGLPNRTCGSFGGVMSVRGNYMNLVELDGFP